MRVIIIDDEKNARETVKGILSMLAEDIDVVAEAEGVKSGCLAIEKHLPDLVFLDIRMKDGTGFDMLRQLTYSDFSLVFLTAHDEYALEAFRFSAIDYLLKPIDPDELLSTLHRARKQNHNQKQLMEILLQNMEKINSPSRKIVLKSSDTIHLVCSENIIHCESNDNYTRFFIKDKKTVLISQSLKSFDEMLSPLGFLRIHQSHLINLAHISKIDRKNGFHVEMSDGTTISVAVRKKDLLLKRLEEL